MRLTRSFDSKNHFNEEVGLHFISPTLVGWVNLMMRPSYFDILYDSLNFCITQKGLRVHAYVFMSNHIHLIVSSENRNTAQIIQSFKRFTARKLIEEVQTNWKESRTNWLLIHFKNFGLLKSGNENYQVWSHGNHPIAISSESHLRNTIHYIHQNPVKKTLVSRPEHFVHSSAKDYVGTGKSKIPIDFIN